MEDKWIVYVLKSLRDGKRYTGMTSDFCRRLCEHQRGKTKSTRFRGPFQVLYFENCATRADARAREKYLKSPAGRRFLVTKVGC
jgi:putative endonuclease